MRYEMSTTWQAAWLGFVGCCFTAGAHAHHSFAMFDFERTVTIEGTIRQFQWTNPHVVIWVDVPGQAGGEPQLWGVEVTSPGNLLRAGWTKRSFNTGDEVSISIGPLRDGRSGGAFRAARNFTTGESLEYDYARLAHVQSGATADP
jgi:hypothetical protein